jgi:hypothetical protein
LYGNKVHTTDNTPQISKEDFKNGFVTIILGQIKENIRAFYDFLCLWKN